MKDKIYIAGPYSKGDVIVNVRNAIDAAATLADAGFAPYCPHLNHFWHIVHPRAYESWLELDLEFLPYCNALLRLPGESNGANGEVAKARELGIKVYYSIKELLI